MIDKRKCICFFIKNSRKKQSIHRGEQDAYLSSVGCSGDAAAASQTVNQFSVMWLLLKCYSSCSKCSQWHSFIEDSDTNSSIKSAVSNVVIVPLLLLSYKYGVTRQALTVWLNCILFEFSIVSLFLFVCSLPIDAIVLFSWIHTKAVPKWNWNMTHQTTPQPAVTSELFPSCCP